MAKIKLLMSLCLLTLIFCTPSTKLVKGKFTYTNMHSPRKFLIQAINKDPNGIFWGIGASDFWGFDEFWITRSTDSLTWSPPLFTGIPAKHAQYIWNVHSDSFFIKQNNTTDWLKGYMYRRDFYSYDKTKYQICLHNLMLDRDHDGLSDYVEQFLYTDPEFNDTDGDGKADGYDSNPLAHPAEKLKIHQKLHKHIIEFAIDDFMSDQLLIVEQIHNKPMEYKRKEGYVLSMTSEQIDRFLTENGYGVPILSTIISDTLRKYKVQFEFFVSPDDAWGFDAIYDWDKKKEEWIKKKSLFDWEADYTGIATIQQNVNGDSTRMKRRITCTDRNKKRVEYKAKIGRMPTPLK